MTTNASALKVNSIRGYKILDSRNNPSVACVMKLSDGKEVMFKVPSGASTGEKEALELRDGGTAFRGKGVSRAVHNINERISIKLKGINTDLPQNTFDNLLIKVDGTPDKSSLGANAILAVSGAFARAKAHASGMPLYQYFLAGMNAEMPVPQFNVLNAGNHADTGFEVQETMVIPAGASSFGEALAMSTDVWYALKEALKKAGHSTGRGDEGGFVNPFTTIEQTIETVLAAIAKAGYKAGKQVMLGFDGAFSEIYGKDLKEKKAASGDTTYHLGGEKLSSEEIVAFWARQVEKYPIISIEDGMSEQDTAGWRLLTEKLGKTTQLVLDDYICTNPEIIRQAILDGVGNSSLIKLNQVGTVTETIRAMDLTNVAGRSNVISHRSGETEDDFIAHMAMHIFVQQIKSGSSGADRNAKYNTLWMIEQELGREARYRGLEAFPYSVAQYWGQRIV